jgi:hypothetical protein
MNYKSIKGNEFGVLYCIACSCFTIRMWCSPRNDVVRNQNVTCCNAISDSMKNDIVVEDFHVSSIDTD